MSQTVDFAYKVKNIRKNLNHVLLFSPAIIILLFAGLYIFVFNPATNQIGPGYKIGQLAPGFKAQSISDQNISLEDYKGKTPVIFYSMATWCPTCKESFQHLKDIYPAYSGKVKILAIDVDSGETLDLLGNYSIKNGFNWDFALGNNDMLRDYQILGTDVKIVLNKDGRIVDRDFGVSDAARWNDSFQKALAL